MRFKFFNSKVLILHGSGVTPDDCFYKWLGEELKKLGCQVFIPSLPNPNDPNDREQAMSITGNYDIIIGHSFGCLVAMKLIPRLKKVSHLILVSGFTNNSFYDDDPDIDLLQNSSNWKFQFDVIKRKCDNIHVLYPTEDTCVTNEQTYELARDLGVKVTIFQEEEDHACGHKEPGILDFIKSL